MTTSIRRLAPILASLLVTSAACSAKAGKDGTVPPLVNDVHGTVTDGAAGLAGVQISASPGNLSATSAADGTFTMTAVPLGAYQVTFHKDGYVDQVVTVAVNLTGATQVAVALVTGPPTTPPPTVTVSDQLSAGYGAAVQVTAVATGDAPLTYAWSQVAGPAVVLGGADTATVTFTSGDLLAALGPLAADGRFGVLGINPDQALAAGLTLTVTDGKGRAVTASVTIDATRPTTGLAMAPLGIPVWLQGDAAPLSAQAAWDWALDTTGAPGSAAAITGAASRFGSFVPDVAGSYVVTESVSGKSVTIFADTWTGEMTTVAMEDCTICHSSGGLAPDLFTPWKGTSHFSALQRKIDGTLGTFAESCLQCHTVGYDTSATNGGFDDVEATAGWTFPATLETGNWDALLAVPDLGQRAGIQCESCHGPQGSGTAHAAVGTRDAVKAARVGWSSDVCASCHQERPYHQTPEQWGGSAHARLGPATIDGTTESRGTTAAHCGRCHTAQGYAQYAAQLALGYSGNLTSDGLPSSGSNNATVASLNALGLTLASVQPITCAACHDPHDATHPHQLRVYDVIASLPNGLLGVAGAGTGATCMACHNTRNGEHDDFVSPPVAFTSPHVAAQTDVLYGFNAYWTPRTTLSGHLAVADTCAGCHVRIPRADQAAAGASTNHAFVTDTSICSRCHSAGVDGKALMAGHEAQLASLTAAALGKVGNLVANALLPANGSMYSVRAWDPATDLYSSSAASNVLLTVAPLRLDLVEIHGQVGFILHLPAPQTIPLYPSGSITTADVYVQSGSLKNAAASAPLYAANSDYNKVFWNLMLLEDDGSSGIHNPAFFDAVVVATTNKVAALP